MSEKFKKIGVVILAAGKGTRLNSIDRPKVMVELGGKPIVSYLVETLEQAGFVPAQIVLVVGYLKEQVMDYFGTRVTYVHQEEQKGTAHAVSLAQPALSGIDTIVVLYGDMPFLRGESVLRLLKTHKEKDVVMTVMTARTPDFIGWRAAFETFGRVVRDENENIKRIVEWKDATADELRIRELSTCYFCFKAEWLWQHAMTVKPDNGQKEYYLTDLIPLALREPGGVASMSVDLKEAIGINRREDLDSISHHMLTRGHTIDW